MRSAQNDRAARRDVPDRCAGLMHLLRLTKVSPFSFDSTLCALDRQCPRRSIRRSRRQLRAKWTARYTKSPFPLFHCQSESDPHRRKKSVEERTTRIRPCAVCIFDRSRCGQSRARGPGPARTGRTTRHESEHRYAIRARDVEHPEIRATRDAGARCRRYRLLGNKLILKVVSAAAPL